MGDPLRIDSLDTTIDPRTPRGEERARAMIRVVTASRLIEAEAKTTELTPDDTLAILQTLEAQAKNGWLEDFGVAVLGLRQTARYNPSGRDNASEIIKSIAEAGLSAPDGKKELILCNDFLSCDTTPITRDEFRSIFASNRPVTPAMSPSRAVVATPATVAIANYIAVSKEPQLVTNGASVAQAVATLQANATNAEAALAKKENRAPRPVDAELINRRDFRICLRQSEPGVDPNSIDLDSCAAVGANTALFGANRRGTPYQESDPVVLVPTPDRPRPRGKSVN